MLTQASDLIRKRFTINHRNGNAINIADQSLINFSNSDYLGLAEHPLVKQAFIDGVQQFGIGSSASALVSGFYHPQQLLEEKFAEFLNRDKALLYNSGYLANIDVITALTNRNDKIIADKYCHASLLDGIQLSRAKCVRYPHNDINQLTALLSLQQTNLVITESVFSMEGDISPIDLIAKTASAHQTLLMVDDAHGAGILGNNGRGVAEHFQLTQNDLPCLTIPLSKAFASMGAIVAGPSDLIECLLQFSKTYRSSTALPPAVASATLASLKIIEQENWRRHKLQTLIQFFIAAAKQRGLRLVSQDLTPIKPILIGDNDSAVRMQNVLMKHGFFVSCIRPPSVPLGGARIRISLNCMHSEQNIIDLLDLMATHHEKFS
jgi:8-amino-7-oxononanoate synthase